MVIGVTGALATGTSTAARRIAHGIKAGIISADEIAHSQIKGNRLFIKDLISYFGADITDRKSAINRRQLAKKAFSKKADYNKLCSIAYPVIIACINSRIKRLHGQGIDEIVIDGPMLIESGFYRKCGLVIVVTASLPLQIQRCAKKRIPAKDALSRIRFQMPLCEKVRYADYIIDNSGDLKGLYGRCREIITDIKQIKTGRT
jgi:dephospho-CoA kinase